MTETPIPGPPTSSAGAELATDSQRQALHDLRGTLSTLSSAARLLELSAGDAEQTRKTAALIRRQVKVLEQQVALLTGALQPGGSDPSTANPPVELHVPQNQPLAAASDIPLRVLVVDDDRAAAHLLKRLLEKLGCLVEAVNSGAAALAMLEPFAPELVISDVEMPGLSGGALASEIRHRAPQPRPVLVALSGHDVASCHGGSNSGFDQFFTKPLDWDQLEQLIMAVVGSRSQR